MDDKGFWPCYDDTTGINVWIALSEISSATGGGLAIAPGSHKLEWNRQAASIIHENFGTCNMETLAPDYHSILESMKVVYDMQPGDAIIHDRWLYHRADPFKKINSYISTSSGSSSSGVDTSATATVSETGYLNRYSIRYMPETARAYNVGLMKPEYTEIHFRDSKYTTFDGHPLSDFGTDYFPQVYPTVIIG